MNSRLLPRRVRGATLKNYTCNNTLTYSSKDHSLTEPAVECSIYLPKLDKSFKFVIGDTSYFYKASAQRIRSMRNNPSFIELFPYDCSPMVYKPEDLERYRVLELCEAIGHHKEKSKSLYLLVSEHHIYTFVQISGLRTQPSLKAILNARIECQRVGIDFRLSPLLEEKMPQHFYDDGGINF